MIPRLVFRGPIFTFVKFIDFQCLVIFTLSENHLVYQLENKCIFRLFIIRAQHWFTQWDFFSINYHMNSYNSFHQFIFLLNLTIISLYFSFFILITLDHMFAHHERIGPTLIFPKFTHCPTLTKSRQKNWGNFGIFFLL